LSLSTYAGLVASIQAWMVRADLSGTADDFIDLFEAWANRNLRVRQMEAEATSTAEEYIALPTDFLELRDIQYMGSPTVQLEYLTPELSDKWYSSGESGIPKFYTMVGNQIRLVPPPSSSDTNVRISYWQKIEALSSGNTTNWLLEDYPDAYLYGSLMHARVFVQDPQIAQYFQQGYAQVMSEIERAGKKSNIGGSLTIRPV
jgi:hypothetical protein